MSRDGRVGAALLGSLALLGAARGEVFEARDDAELRAALARLGPGDTLRLHPGDYRGGLSREGLEGSAERPVVIEAADPARPPVIVGGGSGLHLVAPSWVTVRKLTLRGASGNGLNLDDGGRPERARGVRLEDVRVEDVGPRGNCDGIKLSGLEDFVLLRCEVAGWGGSAVDLVGCQEGRIEGCRFEGRPGFSQSSGVQLKGGTRAVAVLGCTFLDAGERALNLGGSTGDPWFRPLDAGYEAKDLRVEGCRFRGSQAPIAFVGVDGAVVRRCTFYRPGTWVIRILQERQEPRFVACRGGRFEENLVVFRRGELRRFVNVGPGTAPETFAFRGNWWFAEDAARPADHRPELPVAEEGGVFGTDPGLDPERLTLRPRSPARRVGADAWEPGGSTR